MAARASTEYDQSDGKLRNQQQLHKSVQMDKIIITSYKQPKPINYLLCGWLCFSRFLLKIPFLSLFQFFCLPQRCVQVLLDHSVSLLYRPKHLKRLINNTATLKDAQNIGDDDTFDDEVKAMNVYVFLLNYSFVMLPMESFFLFLPVLFFFSSFLCILNLLDSYLIFIKILFHFEG